MALPQHKSCLSILRSILGPGAGGEARFAEKIGRSTSWLKKASCGQIALTRDAALVIAYETGISSRWLLEGDTSVPPYTGNYKAYTQETYALHRQKDLTDHDWEDSDIARQEFVGCIYPLAQGLRAAIEKNRGGLFAFHLSNFVDEMNRTFGKGEIFKSKFGRSIGEQICEYLGSAPITAERFSSLSAEIDRRSKATHQKAIKDLKRQKKQPSLKSKRPA